MGGDDASAPKDGYDRSIAAKLRSRPNAGAETKCWIHGNGDIVDAPCGRTLDP